MRATVIRNKDELNRERWGFTLMVDTGAVIHFDDYYNEYKDNTRQRNWRIKGRWDRLFSRKNTIENPPLPGDVLDEVKNIFADTVRNTHLIKR